MNIKRQIMRRVYAVWLFRQAFNAFTLKLAFAVVLVWQLSVQVFFARVIENSPLVYGDILGSLSFFKAAVFNADVLTLVILAATAVVGGFLARDLAVRVGGMLHAGRVEHVLGA